MHLGRKVGRDRRRRVRTANSQGIPTQADLVPTYLHSWPSNTNGYTIGIDATNGNATVAPTPPGTTFTDFVDSTGCTTVQVAG